MSTAADPPEGADHSVVIEPQGLQFVARAGRSLFESARAAGIVLPTSCRNGTCRACLCRVLSGRVRHLIEWPGLSAEEKREGCILPCVATPESALQIEAPGAHRMPVEPPASSSASASAP